MPTTEDDANRPEHSEETLDENLDFIDDVQDLIDTKRGKEKAALEAERY